MNPESTVVDEIVCRRLIGMKPNPPIHRIGRHGHPIPIRPSSKPPRPTVSVAVKAIDHKPIYDHKHTASGHKNPTKSKKT